MDGTTFDRVARGVFYLALHPRHAARWLNDRARPQSPLELGLPWVAWPCIDWLDRRDFAGKRVFEYGGGGSSLYFLARGAHVRTVENSAAWAASIRERVARALGAEALTRFELELVDMPEHPGPAERALADTYVNCIGADTRYDLVLVDGADGALNLRMECLARAAERLADGGAIVLDDAWRSAYDPAPAILSGFSRQVFEGVGPARVGVTRTDVYERR